MRLSLSAWGQPEKSKLIKMRVVRQERLFGPSLPSCSAVVSLCEPMAQVTPFDLGQIKAHVYLSMSGAAISRILQKPVGKSFWSEQAIQDAMRRLASE